MGYAFAEPNLLQEALTHRSWCVDHLDAGSNERLEFLGDAVLALAVTDLIYAAYPDMAEGQLAPLRAEVVRAESLAELAEQLGLGVVLRLSSGEEASGGRHKPSILADAMEAVIGAVYLDASWDQTLALVHRCLGERIATSAQNPGVRDYKTRLQEYCARRGQVAPRYVLSEKGPDHAKQFMAVVQFDGQERGRGEGTSKKQAEQAAAASAWADLAAEALRHAEPDVDARRN